MAKLKTPFFVINPSFLGQELLGQNSPKRIFSAQIRKNTRHFEFSIFELI